MPSFIDAATRALGCGYSVFPVLIYAEGDKRHKVPLVKWSDYATRKPTVAELKAWSAQWPWAGIGMPTGNGLAIIDIDRTTSVSLDAGKVASAFGWYRPEEWPAFCQSAGGGIHLYARASGHVANAVRLLQADGMAVDIRGDGGFIVGPGSTCWSCDMRDPQGDARAVGEYVGHLEPLDDLPPLPQEITARQARKEPAFHELASYAVIPQGKKHNVEVSVAWEWVKRVGAVAATPEGEERWLEFAGERIVGRDIRNDREERMKALDALHSAIRKQSQEAGFYTTTIKPQIRLAQEDIQYREEMQAWGFDVERAVQLGDLVVLTVILKDSLTRARVNVETRDFLAMDKFRAAFMSATGVVLPRVKPKSYEKFTLSFPVVKSEGMGLDLMELLKDELDKRTMQMSQAEDEEEVEEMLQKKGMTKVEDALLFKLPQLQQSSPALKSLKSSQMASALQDVGCTRVKRGKAGLVWEYKSKLCE